MGPLNRLSKHLKKSKNKAENIEVSKMGVPLNIAATLEEDSYWMDRNSRVLLTYGMETMNKLLKLRVLIIGMKGIGIEAAKNLILAGPGSVTICDDEVVTFSDLGTNFFLSEQDIGKTTCAKASLSALKSLNPHVTVSLHTGNITRTLVAGHSCVLDCGLTMKEAKKWNRIARSNNVAYIKAQVHGLVGYTFVDFGKRFLVADKTGEEPIVRIIDSIHSSKTTSTYEELVIRIIPDKPHGLLEDKHEGWIKFQEVEGELGKILNNKGPFAIKHTTRMNEIGETVFDCHAVCVCIPKNLAKNKLPKYVSGGRILQCKNLEVMSFKSLETSIEQPIHEEAGFLWSLNMTGRSNQLHVALQAIWMYESVHGKMPTANDERAVEETLKYAIEINKAATEDKKFCVEELDDEVVSTLSRFAECRFQPLCCFFGGVVAQEVIKLTGKFTPLQQWMHIDAFEVLPEVLVDSVNFSDTFQVTKEDREPLGCRYDDIIKIIGRPLHAKLMQSKTFMVGSGALGCELLKNFALLGVACDSEGKGLVTVTDNDHVEISNLSRQFLFKEENYREPKSVAASLAVKKMNPDFMVKPMENLVSKETENVFNETFWQSQDFITNALDNVKAREYVDSQCVLYEKPLLESGTLGTKCNSQVIIPHQTSSYSDGPKESDDKIPQCTVRLYPSLIEHCIEWAKQNFDDLFKSSATKASKYLEDPLLWIKDVRSSNNADTLITVHKIIFQKTLSPEISFESCVKEAYNYFHIAFRDTIEALIRLHPQDEIDEEDGKLFWSGGRIFPRSATFDTGNNHHVDLLISMANILAVNYGLRESSNPIPPEHKWRQKKTVLDIVAKLKPPPLTKVEVKDDDETGGGEIETQKKSVNSLSQQDFERMLQEFEDLAGRIIREDKDVDPNIFKIEAAEFEKDDDTNFHMDFITAASNLRSWNYHLEEASRLKVKGIAGRIIPAIASTTAAVTGLVSIELLKVIQPGKKLEAFKDSSSSLAVNLYLFMQPAEPIKAQDGFDYISLQDITCRPPGFTKWDKTIIKGSRGMLLSEFLEAFKAETGLNCKALNHPSSNVKDSKGSSKAIQQEPFGTTPQQVMQAPLLDTIKELYGEEVLGETCVSLDFDAADDDGNGFRLPQVVFKYVK